MALYLVEVIGTFLIVVAAPGCALVYAMKSTVAAQSSVAYEQQAVATDEKQSSASSA